MKLSETYPSTKMRITGFVIWIVGAILGITFWVAGLGAQNTIAALVATCFAGGVMILFGPLGPEENREFVRRKWELRDRCELIKDYKLNIEKEDKNTLLLERNSLEARITDLKKFIEEGSKKDSEYFARIEYTEHVEAFKAAMDLRDKYDDILKTMEC